MKFTLDTFQLNRKWLLAIKTATLLLLSYFIYRQVFQKEDLQTAIGQFNKNISPHAWTGLLLVFILMFINWGLEARKWQRLINKIDKVSFADSYKAIFCGVTYSVFTPNRTGEYAGRLFYIRNTNIWRAIVVTLIGSLGQILATFLMGTVALILFMLKFPLLTNDSFILKYLLLVLSLLLLIFILLLYFNISLFERRLEKIKPLRRWISYLRVIRHYSFKELLAILNLSLCRYITFTIQYILLLNLFGVDISVMNGFILIALIFLVQTVVPSVTIAELGVRGSVALFFLSYVSTNNLGILSAAFSVWLINLIVPSVIGLVLILIKGQRKTT